MSQPGGGSRRAANPTALRPGPGGVLPCPARPGPAPGSPGCDCVAGRRTALPSSPLPEAPRPGTAQCPLLRVASHRAAPSSAAQPCLVSHRLRAAEGRCMVPLPVPRCTALQGVCCRAPCCPARSGAFLPDATDLDLLCFQVPYYVAPLGVELHCASLCCQVRYCTALPDLELHCTVLHNDVLPGPMLHCTA